MGLLSKIIQLWKPRKASDQSEGFAIAPILYLLGLVGVGAGVLFSGYSQILRSNQTMSNTMAAKNELQGNATTLAATSWLSTDHTLLCPPLVGSNSPSTPLVICSTSGSAVTVGTAFASATAGNLPNSYASISSTGSPTEVGVFKAGSGLKVLDPWGHYYLYCRWENSIGSSNALMIISAGANGKTETKCGDTVAKGDDILTLWSTAVTQNRAAVWQTTTSGTTVTGAQFGNTGSQVNIDTTGNVTVPGTLGVSGTTTLGATTTGAITATSITDSGTLGVTGATTLSSGLSGTSETLSSTLGVTGTSTLGVVSAGSSTLSSATVTANETVGGTLGVTGTSTLGTTINDNLTVTNGTFFGGAVNTATSIVSIGTSVVATGTSSPLLRIGKGVGAPAVYPFTVDQYGNATGGTFSGAFSGNLSGSQSGGSVSATTLNASGATVLSSTLSTGAITGTTAVFSGNVQAASFTGAITIGGGGVTFTGVIPVANGGTGQTSAANALTNLFSAAGTLSGMIPGADLVSGSVTATQLNTTGVVAGTYTSVTVAADGRVTSGTVGVSSQWTTSGSDIYYTTGGVSIGTTASTNKLDVSGGVAIGTGYAGVYTAPTSGAIIQGNVGIGTNNPGTNALQVNGTVNATSFTGSGAGLTSIGTSSITGIMPIANGGTNTASQTSNGVNYYDGSKITSGSGFVYTGGNVGIGTTSPSANLHIAKNASGAAVASNVDIFSEANISHYMQFAAPTASTTGIYFGNSANNTRGAISYANSTAATRPDNMSFNTNGSFAMIINSSGGVGIGTNTPANKLDVNGAASIGYVNTAAPSNGLIVSGNVGIGTTTPRSKLDVNAGEVQVGSSGASCSATVGGAIRFSGSALYYCDGSSTWQTVASGAGSGAANLTVASSTITGGSTTKVLYDNAGVLGEYTITGTGNVVMSASPTLTGTTSAANVTLSGTETWTLGTDYTTTGAQNNVSLGAVSAVRYNGSATATFTGIVAGSNLSGQVLTLHNASAYTLTISNQSASSTAANRVITGTGADLPIPTNTSVTMQYDGTASRWRVTGSSNAAQALAAGSDEQIQYNNSGNMAAESNFNWDYTNHRLGIGTTSPGSALQIFGATSDDQFRIGSSGDLNHYYKIGRDTGTGLLNFGGNQGGNDGYVFANSNGGNGIIVDGSGNVGIGAATLSSVTVNAANLFVGHGTSGNVGIGTTSPVTPLDVVATETAVGTAGVLVYPNANNYSDNPAMLAAIRATPTADTDLSVNNTAATGSLDVPAGNAHAVLNPFGVHGIVTNESTAVNNGGGYWGGSGLTGEVYSSGNIGSGAGVSGYFRNNTGSAGFGAGGDFYAENASGTTTNLVGIYSSTSVDTGSVTSGMYGALIGSTVTSGTITGGMQGLYVNADISGGTVDDRYGIYLDTMSGTPTGDDFALYSAATQPSYFGGNVGIGTATPREALEVNGDIGVSAAGKFTSNYDTSAYFQPHDGAGNMIFSVASLGERMRISYPTGNVGIGTTTPRSKLDVNAGEVQVGSSGASCSATVGGAIRFSGSSLYYCDGSSTWQSVVSGAGAANLTVASSTITGGSTTKVLYDNAGVLGEYTITGTGNVVMSASPTLTGTVAGASSTWSGSVGIGTATTTATLTVNGTEALQFASDFSTATTPQNNVAINTSSAIRYTGAASVTFTGIAAGYAGQLLYLTNAATSTYTLTLANQDAGSSAANRIITGTGASLIMANNSSVVLQYDGAATRWRVIGGSGGGGTPGGVDGEIQYNSSGAFAGDNKMWWDSTNKLMTVGTGAATPAAATGTVAGVTVNFIPQVVSISGSTVSGGVAVNSASTGQMAYYSGASTVSGTSNLYVSSGNIAIGTSTATNLLSLNGQNPQIFWMERDYTSNTAGNSLTVQSGGATSGATNKNGGDLILSGGVSTGTGTSNIQFQTFPGTAGSTTDNTVAARMTITGAGNVGIGNVSPTYNLQINNTSGATLSLDDGSGRTLRLRSANSGAQNVNVSAYSGLGLGGTDNAAHVWIASSGSVGIGTVTPRSKLDVYAAEVQVGSSSASCAAVNGGAIRFSGSSLYYCDGSSTWQTVVSGAGAANLTVATSTIASGATTKVLYDNSGVLGEYTVSGSGNVAMTTSPTFVTPALGTPASGVLTNATGLPISTGVSGLGTGVATFLATPSSANLASALTDETGTGNAVFSASPTLTGTITAAAANFSGNVGIGTTTVQEVLDVYGAIKVAGTGSETCTSSTKGALRFSGGHLQVCQ